MQFVPKDSVWRIFRQICDRTGLLTRLIDVTINKSVKVLIASPYPHETLSNNELLLRRRAI
jgi:hypothetical protein